MTVRSILGILGAFMMIGATGCILPDVHDEAGPPGAGGGSGSASSAASSTGSGTGPQCTGSTVASLRFSNVAPATGAVDFCVGPANNLAGPIAMLAGSATGVAYKFDMEYGYKVDGPINIRVIKAGGSCTGASLGDLTDVCLTNPTGLSSAGVYYVGGATADTKLAVLPNETQDPMALKIRFFNAVHSATSIDFGLTGAATLPTSLKPAVASQVALGHFPPAGNTVLNDPVNDIGFMEITSIPGNITWKGWGAAVSGSASAVAVMPFTQLSTNLGKMLTVVVIGDEKNAVTYPVEFLGFDETTPPVGVGKTTTPQKSPNGGTL